MAQQGQTLTAELIDPDGYAANQVKYQWQANHTNITGATGKTYVLTADDVGKTISVKKPILPIMRVILNRWFQQKA